MINVTSLFFKLRSEPYIQMTVYMPLGKIYCKRPLVNLLNSVAEYLHSTRSWPVLHVAKQVLKTVLPFSFILFIF